MIKGRDLEFIFMRVPPKKSKIHIITPLKEGLVPVGIHCQRCALKPPCEGVWCARAASNESKMRMKSPLRGGFARMCY